MTRDQIMALDVRTDRHAQPSDLRAECRQLIEERATLLEAARYLLAGPIRKDRWANGLRKAVEDAQMEWKKPTLEPLAPAR